MTSAPKHTVDNMPLPTAATATWIRKLATLTPSLEHLGVYPLVYDLESVVFLLLVWSEVHDTITTQQEAAVDEIVEHRHLFGQAKWLPDR